MTPFILMQICIANNIIVIYIEIDLNFFIDACKMADKIIRIFVMHECKNKGTFRSSLQVIFC